MNLMISTRQNDFFIVAIGDSVMADYKIIKKEYSQSELLLKTIQELVQQKIKKVKNQESKKLRNQKNKKSRKQEITGIFVVEGPGAFSALRVGIATANALAYSLQVPVRGVRLDKGWESLASEEQLKKIWEKTLGTKERMNVRTKNRFVQPFYGMEPHITRKNEKTVKQKNGRTSPSLKQRKLRRAGEKQKN